MRHLHRERRSCRRNGSDHSLLWTGLSTRWVRPWSLLDGRCVRLSRAATCGVRCGSGLDGNAVGGFSRPSRAENLQKAMGCLSPISSGCHCSIFVPAPARWRCFCSRRSGRRRCAGSRRSARPLPLGQPDRRRRLLHFLDRYPDANGFPHYGLKSRLDARADQAAGATLAPFPARCCPMTGPAPAVDRPLRHPVRTRRGWHQFVAGCSHCSAGHVPGGGRKLEDRAVRSRALILVLLLETGVLGAFPRSTSSSSTSFTNSCWCRCSITIGLWGSGRQPLCGHQVRAVHAARIGRGS